MAARPGFSSTIHRNKQYLILTAVVVILLSFGGFGYRYYHRAFSPNTRVRAEDAYLYIPTGADFQVVLDSLAAGDFLKDTRSFRWLAEKKAYTLKVRPGRYHIKNRMSNNQLINMLRAGIQEPVKLVFNNLRTKEQLAGRLDRQLETDSASIIEAMLETCKADHRFNEQTILLMFIPNTYELYWNTSPAMLMQRMGDEYGRFWTTERVEKLERSGLTAVEAGILASVVEMETNRGDEKPDIAGVYINRLKSGMPLEADPTVVFASGDFSLRRVLKKHLSIPSPYNTYLNTGLPPGPITLPSIESTDAVLNYKNHDYLFFCASADMSGNHKFARSAEQHMEYAREYQRALNRHNIR